MAAHTNPNGANQFQMDPRQKLCWDLYATPGSETFGNALQSAIKAGYEVNSAKQITGTPWFVDKQRKLNLLSKAEKVLNESLDLEHIVPVIGMFGPVKDPKTKKPLMKVDPNIMRIKQDTAKFVGERLGKRDYSTRQEHTGEGGEALFPTPLLDNVKPKPDVLNDDSNSQGNGDEGSD